MTRNLFKIGFIRIAFMASVGLPLFLATSVNSQTPSEVTTAPVVVTGSNIPTAEEVTANPIDTLTTADVERSGAGGDVLNVLLKRDPSFIGGGNIGSTNANIASGATEGGSLISIRGLPTLVLFEGRRIADSAAIATGGFQFQDVSLFPTALVSRIEVLKDGASAIYGSEAIGGVVNIFLKHDFTGLETGYRYGFTVEPGVAERKAYVIAGVGNDTTNVVAGYQYYEIDPLFQRERNWSRIPGGVTTSYAGVGRDASFRYLLKAALNSPFDVPGVTAGMVPPAPNPSQYQFGALVKAYDKKSTGQIVSFDLSTKPTVTQGVRSSNAYAAFTHKICGEQLEAFGDMIFAAKSNESFLNSQPIRTDSGVVILGSQRVDPITGALVAENRGAPAAFNPFQQSLDDASGSGPHRLLATQRYQFNAVRPGGDNARRFKDDTTFYRVLGGLRSQINKDWFAEAATYYSRYTLDYVNQGLVIAPALNQMIAGKDYVTGAAIPALDFFARNPVGVGPGKISQAQFDTLFGNDLRKLDSFLRAFDIMLRGNVFELPGGPVGVAVGASYMDEGFKVVTGPQIFLSSVPVGQIQAGRNIKSVFAEAAIPIVGSEMNVPGIYSLELRLAGRYDDYEGISQTSKVPKVMLRYQPCKDLTMRATFSDSFVAPTLFQLFGPVITGFSPTITFPGGPIEDQAHVQNGSNPNLIPSKAESWTAGLVYSPHFVHGLTISADYFRTLQQQIVGTLGSTLILNSVEALGPASPYYSLVTFGAFAGRPGATPVGGPGSLTGNLGSTFVVDTNVNLGAQRVEGFDLSAHYIWDLHGFGELELGVNSVVFINNDAKNLPTDSYFNISGLVGSEPTSIPDYKVTGLAEYRLHGWTLSVVANYIPEMLNTVGHDPQAEDQRTFDTVEYYVLFDGRLSYTFHETPAASAAVASNSKDAKEGKGVVAAVVEAANCFRAEHLLDNVTLTVGCNNLLDFDPRFVAGGNSATSVETYDPYGRFVYLEVKKRF